MTMTRPARGRPGIGDGTGAVVVLMLVVVVVVLGMVVELVAGGALVVVSPGGGEATPVPHATTVMATTRTAGVRFADAVTTPTEKPLRRDEKFTAAL
jgi:hypothetical protein